MPEPRDKGRQGWSPAKTLKFVAVLTACLFALGYVLFFAVIYTSIIQPLEGFSQWIDSMDVDDQGRGSSITPSPAEDAPR